ncbi:UPF0755 protein [Granulicella rosea]|uniref:Endolytic murein transglycosylase n=1 Tax=Granulicella rosea TaxID=474952 RepID=A0A239LNZ3_9BACT|nr:endolytic transglycosylase MltG [Granulicella rosea]SNT32266.1 UPF0755 protein [Granulicella rosea]
MKFFKFLLLLIVLGGCAAAYFFYVPYGPSTETFVDIPAGTGTAGIAARLANAGVISNKYVFEAVRATQGGVLKAGEYRFDHPATVAEVYARIAKGDVYTREVSVPEGFNLFDIAAAVEAAGLGTKDAFLTAAHNDTRLIADLSPGAASLEGYLFPDTYRFSRHTTPDQMVAAMVKRFRAVVLPLGLTSTQDVSRTVIMASLVEKEVSVASERPLVAGVFENRLAQHIPLATDPTVIYAAMLAGRWRGTIYRSDLDYDSPYNTYKHAGLPPGPICNAGVAAFRAAISPAKTDYLYFVADAAGHSRFSTNLKDHSAAVQEYRKATEH